MHRICSLLVVAVVTLSLAACHNKKAPNPIANLGSKQPDKVLFDRAMDALKHNKYDVARITLQTLINTYPDSEYIARAKLAVGDSWYAEGGSAALVQAESEYKDFITFFPNMPEAAEAQLKIANIHFHQMEKPDRDFTHAKRAEDEYRQLILQFPDSKLVPEAKQRLLQVQEVLAEREFRIGRFYFLRESWPAAIARLKSLADAYPLYSSADEALFLLGSAYEGQVAAIRASKLKEVDKGKLIKEFEDSAAAAYTRLVTRYPIMVRADDAKKRLQALRRPVPTPTEAAIAQNKAEEAGRREPGMMGKFWENFHKRPDMSQAAHVGEPTLSDPKQTSATEIAQRANEVVRQSSGNAGTGEHTVSVETVGKGAPPPSQEVPRSDAAPVPAPEAAPSAAPEGAAAGGGAESSAQQVNPPQDNAQEGNSQEGIGELKPNTDNGQAAPASPPQTSAPAANNSSNAPTPQSQGTAQGPAPAATDSSTPPVPPPQINEAATDSSSQNGQASATSTADSSDSQQESSSSKKNKKKKKGAKKLLPF